MYDPSKPYKKEIQELIQQTWNTPYLRVQKGTYPLFTRTFSSVEVDHTDGIGTKGFYHWQKRTFQNAVLDVLAMNVNDLALVGATPYKLQNHITLPKDDHKAILEIVEGLSRECKKRGIAMTGGETSIHTNTNSLDISATVSGFIEKVRENKFEAMDVLIGLKSSGLHSNGFTKVRDTFKNEFREEFIEPTTIYSDAVLLLLKKYDIHGMMHITGGAFTKLKDLLDGTDIYIHREHTLYPHQIFLDMYQRGVRDTEMYTTFNCGIGFIFSVQEGDVAGILSEVPNSASIGEVVSGEGVVHINSMFSKKSISL